MDCDAPIERAEDAARPEVLDAPEVNIKPAAPCAELLRLRELARVHAPLPMRVVGSASSGEVRVFVAHSKKAYPRPFEKLLQYDLFVRAMLPMLLAGIDIEYALKSVAEADVLVVEVSVDEKGENDANDPLLVLLASVATRASPALPFNYGCLNTETRVRGFAAVTFMRRTPQAPDMRLFTPEETCVTLQRLLTDAEKQLEMHKKDPLYTGVDAPCAPRLQQYEALVRDGRVLTEMVCAEIAKPDSSFRASFPYAIGVQAQGCNTTAASAAVVVMEPYELFMFVTLVASAPYIKSRAGTRVMRRITAIADGLGANVFLKAVPHDLLPLTFYMPLGFQFTRIPVTFDHYSFLECRDMLRIPDKNRQRCDVGERVHPIRARKKWGTPATRWQLPVLGINSPITSALRTFMLAWDTQCIARSDMLFAQCGILDAACAVRSLATTCPSFPTPGNATVDDVVDDNTLLAMFKPILASAVSTFTPAFTPLPEKAGAGERPHPLKRPRVEGEEGSDEEEEETVPPPALPPFLALSALALTNKASTSEVLGPSLNFLFAATDPYFARVWNREVATAVARCFTLAPPCLPLLVAASQVLVRAKREGLPLRGAVTQEALAAGVQTHLSSANQEVLGKLLTDVFEISAAC